MKLWWQLAGPWVRGHWRLVLLALCLVLSTVFAGIGLLSVAGWFLTGAFLAGGTLSFNLFAPSALVRGLSMWRIASRYAERIVGHRVTLDLQAEIRTQSFAHLASLKPAQLAQYRDGDLITRLINDIERLDSFFLLLVAPVFTALVSGVVFSVLMGVALPVLGWVLLVVLCLAAGVLPYWVARRTAQVGEAVQLAQAELRAWTHDALSAHTDLLVFTVTHQAQQQFEQAAQQLAQAQKRLTTSTSLGNWLQQVVMGALVLALLWLGATAHSQHTLSAPIWVGLLLGAMGLFEVIAPIMRGAAGLGAVHAAAARLQEINASTSLPAESTVVHYSALPEQGTLQLVHVSLSYDSAATVLEGIDLVVPQGQRISIEGLSGSGKTTLLLAIMHIYPLDTGRIEYGGVDLAQVDPTTLYQRFALLSQHSAVFMGTVRHNLLLGDPHASDEALWEVLKQVRLDEQVAQLGGLDTWLGEGGNTLSTGQVRRLSLARTLLTPASVWLLDEPTAGLDKNTAEAWLKDLHHLAKNRTVIMVTHAQIPAGVVQHRYQLLNGRLTRYA
ncbi:thiol reductant ABC exporter subunit CydC [Paenalcaligenes hominis]|uniref:Thiol reductant ABC exporter subunit CydC n=1 Tax=Paenalcaligenes hominis TaxID=643674 RepID=A0A1U9K194_9BURK|nr:thiol reductant ABC exporter subunit CydC [Paenalcaligenes hominis]AQS51815.1 thiol reductant ABC exporter subunit CydC [Paenalcaligenes hominis]